jgi:hypothetical protein
MPWRQCRASVAGLPQREAASGSTTQCPARQPACGLSLTGGAGDSAGQLGVQGGCNPQDGSAGAGLFAGKLTQCPAQGQDEEQPRISVQEKTRCNRQSASTRQSAGSSAGGTGAVAQAGSTSTSRQSKERAWLDGIAGPSMAQGLPDVDSLAASGRRDPAACTCAGTHPGRLHRCRRFKGNRWELSF